MIIFLLKLLAFISFLIVYGIIVVRYFTPEEEDTVTLDDIRTSLYVVKREDGNCYIEEHELDEHEERLTGNI